MKTRVLAQTITRIDVTWSDCRSRRIHSFFVARVSLKPCRHSWSHPGLRTRSSRILSSRRRHCRGWLGLRLLLLSVDCIQVRTKIPKVNERHIIRANWQFRCNYTYDAGSSQHNGKSKAANQKAHGQKYRQVKVRWAKHCRLHWPLYDQRWYDR